MIIIIGFTEEMRRGKAQVVFIGDNGNDGEAAKVKAVNRFKSFGKLVNPMVVPDPYPKTQKEINQ